MVKHLLISSLALSFLSFGANAETKTYTSDFLGEVTAVSPNGEYASVYDYENDNAYLWTRSTGQFTDISAPLGTKDEIASLRVTGTWAMGVADDGTVVGCVFYGDGRQYPSIYKDGEWSRLPVHGGMTPDGSAIAISADCKFIGGYMFISDPSSAIAGRYYPCRWTLKDDGSYELQSYTDIKLPDHQGFYATCMTPDGSAIGGMVFAGVSSTLPGIVTADGQLMIDATIDEKSSPLVYKGKYYCGVDENGKQIWSADPDDPRIVMFTDTYIDGVKDQGGDSSFSGGFQSADANGNFYGARTVASNVSDGTGTLRQGATVYNMKSGTWSDNFSYPAFTYGLGDYIFGPGNTLIHNGTPTTFTQVLDFSYPKSVSAMYKASTDGKVIGGNLYEINPATSSEQYYPFIIVSDKGLVDNSGISGIEAGDGVTISVVNGSVEVAGAASVAVYDIYGRLVGESASTSVEPGVYVVRADGKVAKVLVK